MSKVLDLSGLQRFWGKVDARKADKAPNNHSFDGVDLSTVFASAQALHDALASGDFSKIRIGDYWPLSLSGTFRDYGSYTVPSGTEYFTDNTLTTSGGTTSSALEGQYESATAVKCKVSGTDVFVAIDDCTAYYERTMSNAVINLEVAGINHYWRYGDSGDLTGNNKPHIVFVSRDCLPFYMRMRKANLIWENVVTTQTFTGNGSTKDFTLTNSAHRIGDVYVGGVKKTWNTDYTVSANKVSFKTAPANNAEIKVDALDSDNPWCGSALFKTLNDPDYGVLHLIAQTTIGAYMYAGPNSKGMRAMLEIKNPGMTTVSAWTWGDRGKLFIPFESEIWGHSVWGGNSGYNLGCNLQLPIFAGSRRHISKGLGNGASRVNWWTASSNSGNATFFSIVSSAGYSNSSNPAIANGAPVCFVMI